MELSFDQGAAVQTMITLVSSPSIYYELEQHNG
jgi:hypothetical protein